MWLKLGGLGALASLSLVSAAIGSDQGSFVCPKGELEHHFPYDTYSNNVHITKYVNADDKTFHQYEVSHHETKYKMLNVTFGYIIYIYD